MDLEDGRTKLINIKQLIGEKESNITSIDNKDDKYGLKTSAAIKERNYKILFCFVGLQVSYLLWGVTQENLMTQEYKLGKFKSSAFCVFGNRFFALLLAMGIVLWRKSTSKAPLKEAPFYYYAPSSLSNSISSWAQYEALKYISFPIQVLSKSCKIIPVMMVGILLNNKSYPVVEYMDATLITMGVTMFTLSEPRHHHRVGHHISNVAETDVAGAFNEPTSLPGRMLSAMVSSDVDDTAVYGIILLALYLMCDSFTSQWQSKVYKSYGVDQYQMMLGVNVWSMLMTGFTLYHSGDFLSSVAFLMADSTAMAHMTILSLTSATGQLFIFYTIKELGPVVFTIIMTTRQIFSLFISCVLYSHNLGWMGYCCALFVFLVVFNRIRRKGTD